MNYRQELKILNTKNNHKKLKVFICCNPDCYLTYEILQRRNLKQNLQKYLTNTIC